MKLIFAFLLFVTTTNLYCQFSKSSGKETLIGKAKAGGIVFSELSYTISGADTLYNFHYKDKKFATLTEWKSVFFKGGTQTLDDLYSTLLSALDSAKGTEMAFTLGESAASSITSSSFGTRYLKLAFSNGGVVGLTDLTKKQLDGLFNRKSSTPTED